MALPEIAQLEQVYGRQIEKYIDRVITPEVLRLNGQIRDSQGEPKWVNKLGVLYARYGLYSRARDEFEKILKQRDYVPALLNMGNIHFLAEEHEQARTYFESAYDLAPRDAKVVLAVARVNHELENYGAARTLYRELKELNGELAERYVYLDLRGEEGARAAEIGGVDKIVEWGEE